MPDRIMREVRREIKIGEMITKLKRAKELWKLMAKYDANFGCVNTRIRSDHYWKLKRLLEEE